MRCPINLPAAYDVVSSGWHREQPAAFVARWGVPGGSDVWCIALVTEKELVTRDEFWQQMLERVQFHVRSRDLRLVSFTKGTTLYRGMALTDKPPAIGVDYARPIEVPDRAFRSVGPRSEDGSIDIVPEGGPLSHAE